MTRKIIYISLFLLSFAQVVVYGQSTLPVVIGEVNHREAYIKLPEKSNGLKWYLSNHLNDTIPMSECDANGVAIWRGLKPGHHYKLYAHNDSTQAGYCGVITPPDWQYHTGIPSIRFIAGSCSYINEYETDRWNAEPYGGGYEIYGTMAEENADFNLWLGDNIYLRPSDYSSISGLSRRYDYARSNVYLQMLLSARPNYAIWDDHDAGPNNALGTFFYLEETREVFKHYWPRSKYGTGDNDDLRWVQQASDAVFIGLDNRSHRTSENSPTPQILGKEQIDWLVEQVRFYNRASFIVIAVGGQVLHSEAIYENFSQYPVEREYLLKQLASTGYQNIVFLTGDRHHSEVSQEVVDEVRFTDITVSPLTSGPSTVVQTEANENRVSDYIDIRNYALIEIDGADAETRVLKVIFKDSEGEEIMSYMVHSL